MGEFQYYVKTNGATVGPVSLSLLMRGLLAGKVPMTALARRTDQADWGPVVGVISLDGEDDEETAFMTQGMTRPLPSLWDDVPEETQMMTQFMPALPAPKEAPTQATQQPHWTHKVNRAVLNHAGLLLAFMGIWMVVFSLGVLIVTGQIHHSR